MSTNKSPVSVSVPKVLTDPKDPTDLSAPADIEPLSNDELNT